MEIYIKEAYAFETYDSADFPASWVKSPFKATREAIAELSSSADDRARTARIIDTTAELVNDSDINSEGRYKKTK